MSTATATNAKARLEAPIADVKRRIEALTLQGVSPGAAHMKVMKDAKLRHAFVIATNIKHGRIRGAENYAHPC